MLSISDGEALSRVLVSPLDDRIKRLLAERGDQLGGEITDDVHFAIVQPGDPPDAVEEIVGLRIFGTAEYWPDWVQDHGFAFEMVFDLTEEFTQVVIIPKDKGIDRQLLQYAAAIATEHA